MDFDDRTDFLSLDDFDHMLARPDYSSPSKRRDLVDETFSAVGKGFEDIDREYIWVHADKRKKAVLGMLDRIGEEYDLPDIHSAELSFVEFEACTFTNYDLLDEDENLLLAAALWVLDDLRRNGRLYEAYRFLPDSLMEIDDVYIPIDFFHPCYENELIQSVAHVLNFRREEDPDAFHGLIGLLDQNKMAEALERFKTLQRDVTGRYLRAEEFFDRRHEQFVRKMRSLYVSSALTVNRENLEDEKLELAGQMEELEDERHTFRTKFDDYLKTGERRIQGIRELGKIMGGFSVGDPFEACFAAVCLIRQDDPAAWLMRSGTAVAGVAAGMLPWHGFEEEWDDEDWDAPGLAYNGNGWLDREPEPEKTDFYHRLQDGKNLAQRIYSLSRGIVPAGLHPFSEERASMKAEGVEGADTAADWSELLFLSSFRAEAVNLRHRFLPWTEEEEPEDWKTEEGRARDAVDDEDEKRAAHSAEIAAAVLKMMSADSSGAATEMQAEASGRQEKMISAGGYWGRIASGQGRKTAEEEETGETKETGVSELLPVKWTVK